MRRSANPRPPSSCSARSRASNGSLPAKLAGARTFSTARSEPTSWVCWNTKPNVSRRRRDSSLSPSASLSCPSTTTVPVVDDSSSPSMDSSVDLPDPEGDTKAMESPGSAANEMFSKMTLPS